MAHDRVVLAPNEMDKLVHLWEFHRIDCDHQGDVSIALLPGGGIGTVVAARCGCGKEMDVTDYHSW